VDPRSWAQTEPSRTLLHGFSGSLAGGEMLLVIGKPGSGCTTFLKALADMRQEYKSVTGRLDYSGRPAGDRDPDRVRFTFCGMRVQSPLRKAHWDFSLKQKLKFS
jgi:ATP-binding cassette, subfamily G (WHITE), member 2, SNQ2